MTNSGFGFLRACGSKMLGGSKNQFAMILAAPMSGSLIEDAAEFLANLLVLPAVSWA